MLAPWKKSYDQPRQHLKSRDITSPTKVHLVKAIVVPVVMYGCKSWTIKKAECGRIDAFELWCWEIPLRVPGAARRSNQSIIKEVSLEYSLEGLILKLKLQYFGHLMWRTDSLEKTLMLGKTEGRKRRKWQRMRWLVASLTHWTWVWASSGRWWRTGKSRAAVPGVAKSHTQLSDWTTATVRMWRKEAQDEQRLWCRDAFESYIWSCVTLGYFLNSLSLVYWKEKVNDIFVLQISFSSSLWLSLFHNFSSSVPDLGVSVGR